LSSVTGIYFIPTLLKAAFADKAQSKFLVQKKLQDYFDFGGQQHIEAVELLCAVDVAVDELYSNTTMSL
jgi:hypothetical protein